MVDKVNVYDFKVEIDNRLMLLSKLLNNTSMDEALKKDLIEECLSTIDDLISKLKIFCYSYKNA